MASTNGNATDDGLQAGLRFDNSYARLPERFHVRLPPTPVGAPQLVKLNAALAEDLGLDAADLSDRDAAALFSGNRVPAGAEPLAMAYAGHQFGNFVPQLGDGRAVLLGEVIDARGRRRDIQLKGAGPTPFSRGGDGRAALGPVLREYIVSEAMHALGVPTTRALAAAVTGEPVYRESVLPGAVLTRVAASHIRVGTFQYFLARKDHEALRLLTDHVIERHDPELKGADNPALALFEAVQDRQAALIARWMTIGFIHGVMNTDNTTLSGETIDYGPCAFMDAYDPATVFSSIDHAGRYAFGNQPGIAQWNLARLAECLLDQIDPDSDKAVEKAMAVLERFPDRFAAHWMAGMRPKLGLATEEEADRALAQDLLNAMREARADYTLTFRGLMDATAEGDGRARLRQRFSAPAAFDAWTARWEARLDRDPASPEDRRERLRLANPAFIPRNHRVEAALTAATTEGDFAPFERLVEILQRPFDDQPDALAFMEPPEAHERVFQTFCGT